LGHRLTAHPVDTVSPSNHVYKIISKYGINNIDVVAIDEAQFFLDTSLILLVEHLLYKENKTVLVAGLSQDSEGRPFGAMPHLLSIADEIVKLNAVCNKCKRIGVATRTFKKIDDSSQIQVGGSDIYEARCFEHWNNA